MSHHHRLSRTRTGSVIAAAVVFGLLGPAGTGASETARLELEIAGVDGLAPGSRTAAVTATPLGQVAAQGAGLPAVRRRQVAWPGVVELELEAGPLWEVRVEADGFWDRPFTVALTPGGPAVRKRRRLVPTGVLRGRLDQGAEKAPESVQLRVRDTREGGSAGVRSWAEARCAVDGAVFLCRPPVGRRDLRLSAEGAVPRYLWQAEVGAEEPLDLGAVRFEPGASLSGWVSSAVPRSTGVRPITVTLEPHLAGGGPQRVEERIAATAVEALADERGFFQLRGAAPGTYGLVVSSPGLAPVRAGPVHLVPGRESVLDEEVVLRPPVSLRLQVDPPLDPYGRRWRWELLRREPLQGRLREAGRGRVDDDGRAVLGDLAPGPHLLTVEDEDGSRWFGEEVGIDRELDSIAVELDVVVVDGRVLLGDEPLEGEVVFGSVFAPTALDFRSDREGRFVGHLPHPGEWTVQVREAAGGGLLAAEPVEVEPRDGVADVVVRLPDTRLSGRVLDAVGEPVAGAGLIAVMAQERRWGGQARSGDDGRFVLRGLEPGEYHVEARRGSASSGWVPVSLTEGRDVPDLPLVLRESRVVRGRVTSGGAPVPGATVQAVPQRRTPGPHAVDRGLTDVAGGFQVDVSADAVLVDLLVSPPGLPFVVRRLVLDDGGDRQMDLEIEAGGGDLVLAGVPDPDAADGPPLPALLVHGVPVHLGQVRDRWRRGDGGELVLVDMESGPYALCSAESLHLLPSPGRPAACTGGVLPPFGRLRLDLGAPGRDDPDLSQESTP